MRSKRSGIQTALQSMQKSLLTLIKTCIHYSCSIRLHFCNEHTFPTDLPWNEVSFTCSRQCVSFKNYSEIKRVCLYKPSIFKWNTLCVGCKSRLKKKTHLVNACHFANVFFPSQELLQLKTLLFQCPLKMDTVWKCQKFTLTIKSSKNSVKSTLSVQI